MSTVICPYLSPKNFSHFRIKYKWKYCRWQKIRGSVKLIPKGCLVWCAVTASDFCNSRRNTGFLPNHDSIIRLQNIKAVIDHHRVHHTLPQKDTPPWSFKLEQLPSTLIELPCPTSETLCPIQTAWRSKFPKILKMPSSEPSLKTMLTMTHIRFRKMTCS